MAHFHVARRCLNEKDHSILTIERVKKHAIPTSMIKPAIKLNYIEYSYPKGHVRFNRVAVGSAVRIKELKGEMQLSYMD